MVDSNENYKFDLGVKGLKVDLQTRFQKLEKFTWVKSLDIPSFAVAYLVI